MARQSQCSINIITIKPEDQSWVERSTEVLRRGGIVAVPTDTVYGLAACPTIPGALERLHRVKGRPESKPYTIHIADRREMLKFVPEPPWPARILSRKAWPGPITLVVELPENQIAEAHSRFAADYDKFYYEGAVGLRCPAHPVAQQLLSRAPAPVVLPSANPSGAPAPSEAEQVCEYFSGSEVDLVLDGGPTRFRGSSTVVRVGRGRLEVLREGPISAESVARLARMNILFVCTGNTCRSPMAEALARKLLAEMLGCRESELDGMGVTVGSAGICAGSGLAAASEAIETMRTMGLDIGGHSTRAVTPDLVNRADAIFAMGPEHREFICKLVPGASNRVELVDKDSRVADPLGQGLSAYVDCARRLERLIRERLRELVQ